jgi:hypothetical protein
MPDHPYFAENIGINLEKAFHHEGHEEHEEKAADYGRL